MNERHRWLTIVPLILAVLALGYGCHSWWPRTVDDSFITYRYSQNLADGHGPVFNPDERVEGYSSPSWMVAMALAMKLGIDPEPASKWLGVLSSLGLLGLTFVGLRRIGLPSSAAALGVLVLGSSVVLQIWSVSGLETNGYALLFFAGLLALATGKPSPRGALFVSLLLVAATLTRPEGLLYWLLGLPVAVIRGRSISDRRTVRATVLYLLPGLLLALHFAWRFSYYGEWLPNTYFVKTGGGPAMWSQGLQGLGIFLSNPAHWPWILGATVGALLAAMRPGHRRTVAIMAGAVLLHLLYIVSVGDDGLRIHRFYVAVLGPLAFLFGMLFDPEVRGRTKGVLPVAGLVLLGIACAGSLWTMNTRLLPRMQGGMLAYQEGNIKIGRELARSRPPGTLIAVVAAGAIPFYSRLPAIDMYGLNDSVIAHGPFPETARTRMMKWDNGYVLSRRPDLIVINRGYFPAGDPLAQAVERDPTRLADSAMNRDLFRRVAADGAYAFRPILFEDGSRFYVFERVR